MTAPWWARCWQRRRPGAAANRRPGSRRARGVRRLPCLEELERRTLLSDAVLAAAVPLGLDAQQTAPLTAAPAYYRLTVSADGRLTAQVHADGGHTRLSLLGGDGGVLLQSDGQSAADPDDRIDLHVQGSADG